MSILPGNEPYSGGSPNPDWQPVAPSPGSANWAQQEQYPSSSSQWAAQQQTTWQQPVSSQPNQQQNWNQAANQAAYAPEPKPVSGFGNIFDFSFKKFVLGNGTGAIFMIVIALLSLKTLFVIIAMFDYRQGGNLMINIISELLQLGFMLLVVRVLLEIGTATVNLWLTNQEKEN